MDATMEPAHCGVLAMFPGFSYDYRSDMGLRYDFIGPLRPQVFSGGRTVPYEWMCLESRF